MFRISKSKLVHSAIFIYIFSFARCQNGTDIYPDIQGQWKVTYRVRFVGSFWIGSWCLTIYLSHLVCRNEGRPIEDQRLPWSISLGIFVEFRCLSVRIRQCPPQHLHHNENRNRQLHCEGARSSRAEIRSLSLRPRFVRRGRRRRPGRARLERHRGMVQPTVSARAPCFSDRILTLL